MPARRMRPCTTRLSFERLLAYLDNFDDPRRQVASVQRWVGREQVRVPLRAVIVFPARSRGAHARLFDLTGSSTKPSTSPRRSAGGGVRLPTMSARPNTQSWLFGTPPTHVGDGEVPDSAAGTSLSGRAERLTWLRRLSRPLI